MKPEDLIPQWQDRGAAERHPHAHPFVHKLDFCRRVAEVAGEIRRFRAIKHKRAPLPEDVVMGRAFAHVVTELAATMEADVKMLPPFERPKQMAVTRPELLADV